ncbi:MAG: 4Fe-4S double cluster binding domain-containing protein [Smithellaceae bacterium]|nr:4Fe-4S double cluster binding domain-containing protein [Smithellaceae bacterium]
MLDKEEVVAAARDLGFDDVGFTTAEAFASQETILTQRAERYAWTKEAGLDLLAGVNPRNVMLEGKAIIVLLKNYHHGAFPPSLLGLFGRCYLDDDRLTKDGLSRQFKKFRQFLADRGISSKSPINLPHRLAAARAGLGDFGKNCLFYARRVARGGSWVLPLVLVVDREFAPDEPSVRIGCPDWCRNACIAACPTGALKGPAEIDPRKCISFLTYNSNGLTPASLRAPMGMWVYGCDRCQEVCPRNAPWLNQRLPENERVGAKADNFALTSLLQMDRSSFETLIWPHMFYTDPRNLWRWQMNAARAMGNSRDEMYLAILDRVFEHDQNDFVKAMAAWAIGRIGGVKAGQILARRRPLTEGTVLLEIEQALAQAGQEI